jgi:hypothetical protein
MCNIAYELGRQETLDKVIQIICEIEQHVGYVDEEGLKEDCHVCKILKAIGGKTA